MRKGQRGVCFGWPWVVVSLGSVFLLGATRGPQPESAAAAGDRLNAHVVASGGTRRLVGTDKATGVTVGEPAGGVLAGDRYQVKVGFWTHANPAAACPVVMTGDVNLSGNVALSDIVYLVNYVFKAGPAPLPCLMAGDVNCSGGVVSSDIIYLVGAVLKGGPSPCDVCTMWPTSWSCP